MLIYSAFFPFPTIELVLRAQQSMKVAFAKAGVSTVKIYNFTILQFALDICLLNFERFEMVKMNEN